MLRLCLLLIPFALWACEPVPEEAPATDFPEDESPVITVASTTQIARLNEALPDSLSITRAYAVRSETHEWAHYIAAKLRGASADTVGIWFMYNGMDVPGDGFAVNAVARNASALPPFPDVAPNRLTEHPEIVALKAFVYERP